MAEGKKYINSTASVSPSALHRAVTRAYRLTDENHHTEARKTFARLFGYDDLVKRYDEVNRLHMEAGHLTKDLSDMRDAIDETMEERIRRQHGEDTLKQVYRGL